MAKYLVSCYILLLIIVTNYEYVKFHRLLVSPIGGAPALSFIWSSGPRIPERGTRSRCFVFLTR